MIKLDTFSRAWHRQPEPASNSQRLNAMSLFVMIGDCNFLGVGFMTLNRAVSELP